MSFTTTYQDLLNGTGSLDGRTPDIGAAVTAPTLNFVQTPPFTPTTALTALVLDGSGGAQLNKTILGGYDYVMLRLPDATNDDQFIEIVLEHSPLTQTVEIDLIARALADADSVSAGWLAQFATGLSLGVDDSIGIMRMLATKPDGMGGTLYGSAIPPGYAELLGYGSYPTGPYTITYRLEVVGLNYNVLVDGVSAMSGAFDPGFILGRENYIRIWIPGGSFNDGNNYTGALSNMKVLSMSAGVIAATPFWTRYVKTFEVYA